MLGQPSSMLIPPVLGFRLTGRLPEGATATDLVLTITEALRKHGVVGKFVEFFGPGLGAPDDRRPRHARQHVPRVRRHRRDLPDRRHDARLPAAHRPRRRRRSRWSRPTRRRRACSAPTRPPDADLHRDDRARSGDRRAEPGRAAASAGSRAAVARRRRRSPARSTSLKKGVEDRRRAAGGARGRRPPTATALEHGSVVIAAITSCTNTSNPSVMIGAGLVAKKAVEKRPDAQAVGEDQPGARARKSSPTTSTKAGLDAYLDQLGFNLVGYGCTTCIGNSGPLPDEIVGRDPRARPRRRVGAERQPQLRGPHPAGRARQLPGVAAAGRRLRAGRLDERRPHHRAARRRARDGKPVYLKDIWPTEQEIQADDAARA